MIFHAAVPVYRLMYMTLPTTTVEKCVIFINDITDVYPYTGAILYSCFGHMAYIMMVNLSNRVVEEMKILQTVQNAGVKDPSRWKRQYGLICDYVSRLSTGYGIVLLFFILGTFVKTINNSFYGLMDLKFRLTLRNSVVPLLQAGHVLFYFSLFSYICHSIRDQVNSIVINKL